MANPIPLLAIAAAAFFLMKKKAARDNVYVVTDTNELPKAAPPYIQVASSYEGITSKDLEDVVRPIAAANLGMGFIIAAGSAANRLSMSQLGVELAPDVFDVTFQAAEGSGATTKGVAGPATLSDLQTLVNEAVAFNKAPYSG